MRHQSAIKPVLSPSFCYQLTTKPLILSYLLCCLTQVLFLSPLVLIYLRSQSISDELGVEPSNPSDLTSVAPSQLDQNPAPSLPFLYTFPAQWITQETPALG